VLRMDRFAVLLCRRWLGRQLTFDPLGVTSLFASMGRSPSGPSRRRRVWLLASVLLIILAIGVVSMPSLMSPYSWAERDWNSDGRTTIREFIAASDVGTRPANCTGGRKGTEYFSLKDGFTVRLNCDLPWAGP
jgi:hypothetical protein